MRSTRLALASLAAALLSTACSDNKVLTPATGPEFSTVPAQGPVFSYVCGNTFKVVSYGSIGVRMLWEVPGKRDFGWIEVPGGTPPVTVLFTTHVAGRTGLWERGSALIGYANNLGIPCTNPR